MHVQEPRQQSAVAEFEHACIGRQLFGIDRLDQAIAYDHAHRIRHRAFLNIQHFCGADHQGLGSGRGNHQGSDKQCCQSEVDTMFSHFFISW